jgi:hypothetical protein
MTCPDARAALSALLDDELDPAARQAVEAHLGACPECRRELDRLRATVGALGRLGPARAPAGFVDRVLAAAYPRPWYRRLAAALFVPLRVKLPLEAAAVALVAVAAVYLSQRVDPGHPPAAGRSQGAAPAPAARPMARAAAEAPGARPREEVARGAAPAPPPPSREAPQAPGAAVPPESAPLAGDGARAGATAEGAAGGPAPDVAGAEPRARSPEATPPVVRSAPALAAQPAAPTSRPAPDVIGRLVVPARAEAEAAVEDLRMHLGAVRLDRRAGHAAEPVVVELLVPPGRYGELAAGLARIGRWEPAREPAALAAALRVEVRITDAP